jgi:hypothetical protein
MDDSRMSDLLRRSSDIPLPFGKGRSAFTTIAPRFLRRGGVPRAPASGVARARFHVPFLFRENESLLPYVG